MNSTLQEKALEKREREHNIHDIFPGRWSPRAMTGENITEGELQQLFEAARWAPSSYNMQPWTFLYAKSGTEEWDLFYEPLVEFNQAWTKNASHLIAIVSMQEDEKGRAQKTASLDTGAAWQNLALQAAHQGLVAHGMAGLDFELATKNLKIPKTHKIEAMVAIGKLADKEQLSEDLAKNEEPSDRKKVSEIARQGIFEQ